MLPDSFTFHRYLIIIFLTLIFQTSFSQKFDAEVISQETTIEIQDHKLVKKHFYAIRINNRNGDSYAEISIPFNKMNGISNLQAYILDDADKKVKSLRKADIVLRSKNPEGSFYTDSYVKEFSLRNNAYPYTLIYSYQEEAAQFLSLDYWLPVIDPKIPTLRAKLTITIPKDYKIYFRSNKVEKPKVDTIENQIYYHWQASYADMIAHETWSPSIWQFIPYVYVVPEHFRYETEGFQNTWIAYGNWNLSLQSKPDELPSSELLTIHRLTDNIHDTTEKIRALFHYLQKNTRYINVSIKTGGMKPYPAAYVAEKKYGDCKALSTYFEACLASIGIKSFYTTINAGTVIEPFDTSFPSQQFNHVIVFVPLQKDTLWVDCTSDLAFGYLGTFTQNRPALVQSFNNSKLINTPALSFEDVLQKRSIKAVVGSNNSLHCEFSGTYRGYQYESLSGISSELSETERNILLSRYLVETGFQLGKYTTSSPGPDIPEIGLQYSATSNQYVKSYGNESLLKVIPIELPILEAPKRRKLPVQINYPINKVDTINYTLPSSYTISSLPENIILQSDYGEYHVHFWQHEQSAQVIKELRINACTVDPDEYLTFYKFYNEILETEKSLYITLTHH
jgi:hypothetical protein